jgi:peptidyl-prolyl cis-trans isomerase SurA
MILKRIIFIIILILIFQNKTFGIENKILFKINNKIITSVDIFNHINYLSIINPNIKKLDKNKIFEVSKNSLITYRIKEIEIIKKFQKLKLEDEFTEKLLINRFAKLGLNSINDIEKVLSNQNIPINNIKKKLVIEYYWNNLIVKLYSDKVKIDKEKIKNNIEKSNQKKTNSFLLSEIVFEAESNSELENKLQQIKLSIKNDGFENTALIYSISNSANDGGKIGWVNESSINKNIKQKLLQLKNDEYTDPIKIPSGFMILKLNELKEIKKEVNINDELNKLIFKSQNDQLNQYSNMYLKKIKKNIQIEKI